MDLLSIFNEPQRRSGLAAGTLVTTPDSDKPIEEIKASDLVLSGVGADKTSFYRVAKVMEKPYCGPMLRIRTGDSDFELAVTPNHICFGITSQEHPTGNTITLSAFDVDTPDYGNGENHFVHKSTGVTDIRKFATIDEAEENARRMSQSHGGIDIERFAVFTNNKDFKFRHAMELKNGMQVPITKNELVEPATITSITEEHYDGLVYDLDVPGARNFAANGVLVHDATE